MVLARRSGNTWYVAGINGTASTKEIPLALDRLPIATTAPVQSFADSGDVGSPWLIRTVPLAQLPAAVSCLPQGGFLLIINPKKQQ